MNKSCNFEKHIKSFQEVETFQNHFYYYQNHLLWYHVEGTQPGFNLLNPWEALPALQRTPKTFSLNN